MVYDCFSFYNELDLLEIRLNVLDSVVDYFVLVEATRTFSNKEKPLYFEENKNRFAKFLGKIIHIKVDSYPEIESSWTIENYQRNKIMDALVNCKPDDIVIISDLDEIVSPDAIQRYDGNGICSLEQSNYSFFINYKSLMFNKWNGARILKYKDFSTVDLDSKVEYGEFLLRSINIGCTPTKIRITQDFPVLKKAGWHFTYLGGREAIQRKVDAFAHQEFNNNKYTSDKVIDRTLKYGIDLYNPQDNMFYPVSINKSFPDYIRTNPDKYLHHIINITPLLQVRFFIAKLIFILKYFLIRMPLKKLRMLKKHFSTKD